jgi:hypothetical protein
MIQGFMPCNGTSLGTPALTREVVALRCGLSAGQWDDDGSAAQCRTLLTTQPERDTQDNVTKAAGSDNVRFQGQSRRGPRLNTLIVRHWFDAPCRSYPCASPVFPG